jgi:hypothetical protein
MRIPEEIRQGLRILLWARADELGWQNLSWVEKSPIYEHWTRDADVGGVLSRFMDARQLRVYIKDTLMKGYVRNRQADALPPLRMLSISTDQIAESFERPHGRRLRDGRLIVWGNAEDWKLVVTAVHERAYGRGNGVTHAVVLFQAFGKFQEVELRTLVEDAATRLGVGQVLWVPS